MGGGVGLAVVVGPGGRVVVGWAVGGRVVGLALVVGLVVVVGRVVVVGGGVVVVHGHGQ